LRIQRQQSIKRWQGTLTQDRQSRALLTSFLCLRGTALIDVLYTDRKGSYSERRRYATIISDPAKRASLDFSRYTIDAFDPDNLDSEAEPDMLFATPDEIYSTARKIKPVSKKYIDHIYREAVMPLLSNPELKLTSEPNESALQGDCLAGAVVDQH